MRRITQLLIALAAVVVATHVGAAQAATPTWQVEQPGAAGGAAPAPLGAPSALTFIAPNRGLLQVAGSGSNPAGVWTYDGQSWTLLSNVCGAANTTIEGGTYGGIVTVPGHPDDFWTISDPAPVPTATSTTLPSVNQDDLGDTLCHFQNGQIVGSYAVLPDDPNTYLPMRGGACLSADNCWFGGNGVPPSTTFGHHGSFHLHWNGTKLTEDYGPQNRSVTSMSVYDNTITQTSDLGPVPYTRQPAVGQPANAPVDFDPPSAALANDYHAQLVQNLNGQCTPSIVADNCWANDPYYAPADPVAPDPAPTSTTNPNPQQQVDVLDSATSGDGNQLWISGGAAEDGSFWTPFSNGCCDWFFASHTPFLALRQNGGPFVTLSFSASDETTYFPDQSASFFQGGADGGSTLFTSVAPIPGTDEAWVSTVNQQAPGNQPAFIQRYAANSPTMLLVKYDPNAPAGTTNASVLQSYTLQSALGAVMHLACPAANDCWAATIAGWLLHWTDGTQQPVSDDPAYANLISIRPPDQRTPQPIPTGDPFDDSNLFEPQPLPPVPPAPPAPPPPPRPVHTKHIGVLIRHPRSRAVGQREIEVSFELMRPAMVGLLGVLHGRQVGRTPERKLIPGDQRLYLKVKSGWRPGGLRFLTKELALEAPTLGTGAKRVGSRDVRLTVSAPDSGRLTVAFMRYDGRGRTGSATTRRVTVGSSQKLTTSITLRAVLAQGPLVVHFAFSASPHKSQVPNNLAAQRLLGALPTRAADSRKNKAGSR